MAYLKASYDPMTSSVAPVSTGARQQNAAALEAFTDPIPDRPEWHGLAACGRNGVLGDDPAVRVRIMFPARGADSRMARAVCDRCQVQDECRYAHENVELRHARDVGVWFGTSGRMRRDMPTMIRCTCGTKFQRTKPGQTYCSPECRAEARRESNRRYQGAK